MGEGQRKVVPADGIGEPHAVIGIKEVGPARTRGTRRGRIGELREARPGHLTGVRSLAAPDLRRVAGTVVLVVERQRQLVGTAGVAPLRVVFGVPKIGLVGRVGG